MAGDRVVPRLAASARARLLGERADGEWPAADSGIAIPPQPQAACGARRATGTRQFEPSDFRGARSHGGRNRSAAPRGGGVMGPLAGLHIVEVTTARAGPFARRCLAFLGAGVNRIEAASRPDEWRHRKITFNLSRYPDRVEGARPYNRS